MSHHDESDSLVESIIEESGGSNSNEKLNKLDPINSGESKFKYYTFEPSGTARTQEDIHRCIDFWKYIESRGDIFPQRGMKINNQQCKKKQNAKKEEEEITWTGILNLLKSKQLDKVANRTSIKTECEVKSCDFVGNAKKSGNATKSDNLMKSNRPDDFDIEDHFTLDNLDEFDPQDVPSVDTAVQTDPIYTADKGIQTDETSSAIELRSRLKALDRTLKELADADLTGYFDCICDEPCAWLPYRTDGKTSTDSMKETQSVHKCTCSCGEMNCLCSLCDQILSRIQEARDSFEKLSSFEIEQCPCSQLSCDCLDNYEKLLDVKLEINKYVRETVGDPDAKFGLPVRCACSCQQLQCPCSIVMKLFVEIDELMGYKEKPLIYKDKTLDIAFGADVCRCDKDANELPCACLSFYRQHVEEKIVRVVSPDSASSSVTSQKLSASNKDSFGPDNVCPNTSGLDECSDVCGASPLCMQNAVDTMETAKQRTVQNKLPSNETSSAEGKQKSEKITNWRETKNAIPAQGISEQGDQVDREDDEPPCLCKDAECLNAARVSISFSLETANIEDLAVPIVPPNSNESLNNYFLNLYDKQNK